MIAVLDVNIIAGRKLAEALSRRIDGVLRYAVRSFGQEPTAAAGERTIRLPRGWAGRLSAVAMPWALYRAERDARAAGGVLETIIVTVPHYHSLARRAHRRGMHIVYYCSDDFRAYGGWNPARIERDERALCQIASLSIFVSETLRARAVADYELDPAKTLVLPNASEPRFTEPTPPPIAIAALPRPIFGVAGVFNPRIDLDFLAAVAAQPAVGSLALVGPIEAELEAHPALETLRANDKVHFFGRQPHAEMHGWMSAFDVALIPYAATEFNHFCSPMRLYDHLAIGQPIVATRHCGQVVDRPEPVCADLSTLPEIIRQAAETATLPRRSRLEGWDDRIACLESSGAAPFLFRA